ncbi:hypothetical protein QR680_008502 [Steinernema hermaphroditum]|uniref:Serpentine receptor class gamma n=1 Tax=Steinernema hermaphroditum TaxID=289476 RepID=A0AA39IIB4_9BILA|nr:hypothetical protein QR680_008502 [Steinernema hermaphroditum]
MNTELVWLTVSLLYGIPSFVLYVVILFQLVRPKYRKQFNKPFFRLCFLIGVVDCLAYLMSYIFYTLPTYPLFSSFYGSSIFAPSPFTTFIQFFSYYLIYLQLFGNFFLTLNRFTAIVFPLKHARIWRLCSVFGIHSMLIYISVYTIKNETMSSVLYVLVPWLSDLRYLSPPWVLVIVSTSVRKTIVKTLPQRLNKVSGTKVEPFATK